MTGEVVYVTSFRQLELPERLRGDVRLLPFINITNDSAVRARLLTDEFSHFAGAIELGHLRAAPNLVFGELGASEMGGLPPDRFLVMLLLWIGGLFDNAWLLKDHAMRCEGAYLTHRPVGGRATWTSNFLPTRPSLADGTVDHTITMSADELKAWSQKNAHVESYLHDADSGRFRFMMQKGFARSGRAMRFVKAARSAPDLAFKIAHYCGALETLLTTENAELAHKLSERSALLLGRRGYDRLTVFRTVKKAYGVRSKLVHGDTLQARQVEELPSIAVRLDEYLRTILNAIFESDSLQRVFDSPGEAIEEYFTELLFGDPMKDA